LETPILVTYNLLTQPNTGLGTKLLSRHRLLQVAVCTDQWKWRSTHPRIPIAEPMNQ